MAWGGAKVIKLVIDEVEVHEFLCRTHNAFLNIFETKRVDDAISLHNDTHCNDPQNCHVIERVLGFRPTDEWYDRVQQYHCICLGKIEFKIPGE